MTELGFTQYEQWEPNFACELNIQVDRTLYKYDGSGIVKSTPSGRMRIILEGDNDRMEPYLAALWAVKEKGWTDG